MRCLKNKLLNQIRRKTKPKRFYKVLSTGSRSLDEWDSLSPELKDILIFYNTPFVEGTSSVPVLLAACLMATANALNADSALMKNDMNIPPFFKKSDLTCDDRFVLSRRLHEV